MLFSSIAFAEGTEPAPNYLKDTVFKKLLNAGPSVWVMLAALVALARNLAGGLQVCLP